MPENNDITAFLDLSIEDFDSSTKLLTRKGFNNLKRNGINTVRNLILLPSDKIETLLIQTEINNIQGYLALNYKLRLFMTNFKLEIHIKYPNSILNKTIRSIGIDPFNNERFYNLEEHYIRTILDLVLTPIDFIKEECKCNIDDKTLREIIVILNSLTISGKKLSIGMDSLDIIEYCDAEQERDNKKLNEISSKRVNVLTPKRETRIESIAKIKKRKLERN